MTIEKKNIFLEKTAETIKYTSSGFNSSRYPNRDVSFHASILKQKLENCLIQIQQEEQSNENIKKGFYLEFSSAPNFDLATKSLENRTEGIRLLNVQEKKQENDTNIVTATVYIPDNKKNYFLNKVNDYKTKVTQKEKPQNNDLISSINDIKIATIESLWTSKIELLPNNQAEWCEVWLRNDFNNITDNNINEDFQNLCSKNAIQCNNESISFPELIVKLVHANINQLNLLIKECPFVSEIRRACEVPSFFDSLPKKEQKEWVNELLSRTNYQDTNVAICLLDTGVNIHHPLLQKASNPEFIQAENTSWSIEDRIGHGTEMAGISLFNDFQNALETNEPINIYCKIESVKILPDYCQNNPELYGEITRQAISLAEIKNPNSNRVICMAVTCKDDKSQKGEPSSWSAVLDSITSGSEENSVKRLFIISAGNVYPNEFINQEYPNVNLLYPVENPGQSWNAVTVGAYCGKDILTEEELIKDGFQPLAKYGELSPYSSTSLSWDKKWAIKPDVLFDGGNLATNGKDFTESTDLSLITTSNDLMNRLFTTTHATSPAAAQAAYFAARIYSEYPNIWAETVRALMIHSAEWTEAMKKQFCQEDTKTKGRRILLKTCGYGIPNLSKAIQCLNNSVNLIIQGELQPYDKDGFKEMHIHTLPWPKEILRDLGDVDVTLKITLSYFIEPNPREVGWKDKYRYASCGLRFDINNSNENKEDFKKRINKSMRGDNPNDKGEGSSGSDRWYLGSSNRDVGSIHSDFCKISAVQICECNLIAVYPVSGWWKTRTNLERYNKKVRYALVVSLSTPKIDVDFYTPIITQIQNVSEITIGL